METGTAVRSQLIRLSQAAQILGVGVWTIRRLIDEGALEPVRFGPNGWTRIRRDDVDRLIAGDTRGPQ
jgi:excisionase family DNA binding protein